MMGPRTTWDLSIAIVVLQGLNVAALWTNVLGPTWGMAASVFLGVASATLTFMVTGILRPAPTK